LFLYRSGWLRGCEIPVVVLFGARLIGTLNDTIISRCISNLVLVLKSDEAKMLIPNDFFTVKEISGTMYKIYIFFIQWHNTKTSINKTSAKLYLVKFASEWWFGYRLKHNIQYRPSCLKKMMLAKKSIKRNSKLKNSHHVTLVTRYQFHQRLTSSFCTRRSRKHKKDSQVLANSLKIEKVLNILRVSESVLKIEKVS
jgi:hypothetical protein